MATNTSKRKNKQKARPLTLFLAVCLLVAIVASFPSLRDFFSTPSTEGPTVVVTIPEGANAVAIGNLLREQKLVRSAMLFALRVKTSPYSGKLKHGVFELQQSMRMIDVIRTIASGGTSKPPTFTLVVPEGYSVQQIGSKLEQQGVCTQAQFLKALKDDYPYDFIQNIPTDSKQDYRLQGFLFPDTYEFLTTATPHHIIDTMLGQFAKKYASLKGSSSADSLYRIVTVASLVEREAKLASERTTIAGVIYNRLKKNMKLQIDATVIYAISDGMYDVEKVYYKNLDVKSPYNTYSVSGLPVGPICNPGAAALQAAITPASHDFLYYHTDETKKDGSHIFTRTLEDHSATMTQ